MLFNKPSNDLVLPTATDKDFLWCNAAALNKIALFADLSEGFTIAFVQVDLETDRQQAIQALQARPDFPHLQWISLHLNDPQLQYLGEAIRQGLSSLSKTEQKTILLISGLERSIGSYGDYPPVLSNFNIARDTYTQRCPHPIIFFLPSYAITRFARFAPDVWAWKSTEIHLQSDIPLVSAQPLDLPLITPEHRGIPVPQSRLELLDRLLGEHPEPSLTRADVLNQLGNAYQSHAQYDKAKAFHLESLDLYRLFDRPNAEVEVLNNLSDCCYYLGDYPGGIGYANTALAVAETQNNTLMLATSLNNLAGLYELQGRYSEAEPLLKRSLLIREQQLGADHPDTAESLNNLAGLYESQGRYSEAEPLYKRSLLIKEEQLGADHPDTATSLNNLAGLYQAQGQYSEAEPLYKRSLSIYEEQLGADHPSTAASLNNLAELYRLQGRYSEAEPLYKRSLLIWEEQFGADHPDTARSLNNLAGLYYLQGRYSEAEPLYKRSLLISEEQLGADHPSTATSLNNLAGLYQAQGRYSEAEPLYKRSLLISEQQLGADHPSTATSLNNLAGLYYSQGRYSEAEPLYFRAIEISLQALGQDHPNTQTSMSNFIGCVKKAVEAGQRGQLSAHPFTQSILAAIDRGEV